MTKAPYSLVADNKSKASHNAQQIHKALNSGNDGGVPILYLPNGTYWVDNTMEIVTGFAYDVKKKADIWGEERDKCTIRLIDNCPGFGDPSKPKKLIRLQRHSLAFPGDRAERST